MKIFFICCTFSVLNALGQKVEPLYKNFTEESGLLSSECYQILQDKQGYIWIASDRGVSRYDGRNFVSYTKAQGLPENCVLRMYQDSRERIWFVCLSGKMAIYERGVIHSLPFNNRIVQYVKGGIINSISMDKDTLRLGYFETATSLKIVYTGSKPQLFVNPKKAKLGPYVDLLSNNECSYGWYQNEAVKGFQLLSIFQNSKKRKASKIELDASESHWLYCLNTLNKLYVIQKNNVFVSSKSDWKFKKKVYESRVFCIKPFHFGAKSEYWVGTMDGLFVYNDADLQQLSTTLFRGKAITNLTRDNEGGIWVSTLNAGVFYIKNRMIINVYSNEKVYAFLKQQDNLLLGLGGGSLGRFKNNVITKFSINENKLGYPVTAIFPISGDTVLIRYDGSTFYSTKRMLPIGNHLLNFVNGLFYDKEQHKIISCNSNSTIYELAVNKEIRLWGGYEKKRVSLRSAAQLSNNQVYVATDLGLFEFYPKTNKIRFVSGFHRQLLYLTSKNNCLWLASKEDGVEIKRGSKRYKISRKDGLSSDYCRHIYLENEKKAWLSTNQGVTKVEVLSWTPFRIKTKIYTKRAGLISNDIIQIDEWKGKMVIASSKGLSFLSKTNTIQSTYHPRVFITKITLDGKIMEVRNRFVFLKNTRNIDIDFNGICYQLDGKLQYRYRMVGSDENWKTTANKSVSYKNLPYGNLVFEVQAQSTSGDWDTPIKRISFFFPTPFYKTWWFIVLSAMITLMAIYWIVDWRISKIKHQSSEREALLRKASEMEMKFLTTQMNPHFTFNAMNSIQHFMLDNNLMDAQKYLTKYAKLIRRFLENNMHESISISHEIEMIRLYVEIESLRFSKPIELLVDLNPEIGESCEIPPMIIQPYLENAIWHGLLDETVVDRKINVSFELQGRFLLCCIIDNGIGRKKAMLKSKHSDKDNSLGMLITGKRLQYLRDPNEVPPPEITDLYAIDGVPSGTKVVIYIPFLNKRSILN